MRRGSRLLHMFGATLIATAALAMGATPSSAATPAITVTPDDGAAFLTPQLAACPTADIPGANPSVSGSGFTPSTSVTIFWDGKSVRNASTGPKGNLLTSFLVPVAKFGTHTVVAKDGHGVTAQKMVSVSGFTCFVETGTTQLAVKWGVGGVDPHTAASIMFNNTTVDQTTTGPNGGVNTTFNAPCQHATSANWTVHVIQGGQAAQGSGTFTATC